jgi:hypothetical protein
VPLNLNDVLDNHHYVTVPIVTVIIVIMMTIAVIFVVLIRAPCSRVIETLPDYGAHE